MTDVITDKALNWLENGRDADQPFMLMLQHKAPHREWEPGPDHLNTFDDVEIPEPDNLFDDYENRGSAARLQDMSIEKTMTLHSDLKVWPEDAAENPETKGRWSRTLGRMDEKQLAAWNAAYGPKNQAFLDANLTGKDLVRWKYQRYCAGRSWTTLGVLVTEGTGSFKNTVVIFSDLHPGTQRFMNHAHPAGRHGPNATAG